MTDFFISRNKADSNWAQWIAWQLEEAGYSIKIQDWDFRPGGNFVLDMHNAAKDSERIIIVLSPDFLSSEFTQPEWATYFAKDPTGKNHNILPIRVKECKLEGLLSAINYIDLVEINDEEAAKEVLLRGVKVGRAKPESSPSFPGLSSRLEKPRFPGTLPAIWNVPYLQNPNFTGRNSQMNSLRTILTSSHLAALTGMSGIGKTQIALEYAYRYYCEYEIVWWIYAEEPEVLDRAYETLADELVLPKGDLGNFGTTSDMVKRWLEHRTNWLLIFDSVQDPNDIQRFLPHGRSGHVIVTSCNKNWGDFTQPIEIKIFERPESLAFLTKRTRQNNEEVSNELANELADLPLALAQSAAYIEETGITLSSYLELFRTRRKELWGNEKPPHGYMHTVETTYSLAMDNIRKESPEAAELMNLIAFLAPEHIHINILKSGSKCLPTNLSKLVDDPLAMNRAISILRRYSLIEIMNDTLSVHLLVQVVTRDKLDDSNKELWIKATICLVDNAISLDDDELDKTLYYHAIFAFMHSAVYGVKSEKIPGLFAYGLISFIAAGVRDEITCGPCYKELVKLKHDLSQPGYDDLKDLVENLEDTFRKLRNSVINDPVKLKNLKKFRELISAKLKAERSENCDQR